MEEDFYRLLAPKFELPRVQYGSRIREVYIGGTTPHGTRAYGIILGGASSLPLFDGRERTLARPHVAMQIQATPENIPASVSEALGDLLDDPIKWARFCAKECGAEAVQLKSNLPARTLSDRNLDEFRELTQQLTPELRQAKVCWVS